MAAIEKRKFGRLYGDTYSLLYNNRIECGALAYEYCKRVAKEPAFEKLAVDFEQWRGDLLTSDRELAAFLVSAVLAGLA